MWSILLVAASLAVVIAIRGLVYGWGWPEEESVWELAAAWAGLALLVVAYFQVSAVRLEQMKQRTLDVCMMYDRDPVIVGVRRTLRLAGEDVFKDPRKYEIEIGDLLNYFDTIAIGIEQKLYLERLAKEHMGIIILRACRRYLNADFLRATDPERTLAGYGCLVALVARWERDPPQGTGEARAPA
jgi:hypothetical protein